MLSGINRGGNLGEDVTYSGTVAAAMEGALLGIPSVALSQEADRLRRTPWATARRHAPGVLRTLAGAGWPPNVFLNVNFPDADADKVKGLMVTRQGRRKPGSHLDRREDPRGRPLLLDRFRAQRTGAGAGNGHRRGGARLRLRDSAASRPPYSTTRPVPRWRPRIG